MTENNISVIFSLKFFINNYLIKERGGELKTVVEVSKKGNESNESLVRRFVRKIQSSGKLLQAKKIKFRQPKPNKRLVRQNAIRKSKIKEEKDFLRKIGKLEENTYGRGVKVKIKKK